MTERILLYLVFVTLLWGIFLIPQFQQALAQNEERENIMKNNITKNDFSNLLKSLIKLNEQRVSVLQRLYRLEDYSVLSEVLRSGDKGSKSDANLKNLFLVVLSKNHTDPSRRTMEMQVVDSIPSLDSERNKVIKPVLRSKNYVQTEHTLEPNPENNSLKQENVQLVNEKDSIANLLRAKNRFEIDDGTHTFTTTGKPKMMEIELIDTKHQKPNVFSRIVTTGDGYNYHKGQGRFEIVSNGGSNLSSESRDVSEDDAHTTNYAPIDIGNQDNKYVKLDVSSENKENSKYVLNVKGIITDRHKNSNKISKVDRNIARYNNHYIIHKHSPVNKDRSNEDDKQHPTLNEDGPKANDHANSHHKSNENVNENVHGYEYNKVSKDSENDHRAKIPQKYNDYSKIIKTTSRENERGKINIEKSNEDGRGNTHFNINADKSDEIIRNIKNSKIIEENYNKPTSKENDYDGIYSKINRDKSDEIGGNSKNSKIIIKHFNKPTSIENDYDGKYLKINKDKSNESGRNSKNPKIIEENFNKPTSNEDHHDFKHFKINRDRSHENGHNEPNSKISIDNHHKSLSNDDDHNNHVIKSNQGKSDENRHGIKYPKLTFGISNENDGVNKYSKMNKPESNENYKNSKVPKTYPESKYPSEDTKKSNENDHETRPREFKDNIHENEHGSKYPKMNPERSIEHITKINKENSYDNGRGNKYPNINIRNSEERDRGMHPIINQEKQNDNHHEFNFPKIKLARDNVNKDENENDNHPKLDMNMSYEDGHSDKHTKSTAKEIFDGDYENTGKVSIETYGGGPFSNEKDDSPENSEIYPKTIPVRTDQATGGPESRKTFDKCINKKANKLCTKSCISAYKNVCTRLKCTSRSKKALKKECKRSCKKTFASSSGKHNKDNDDDDDY